MIPQQFLSLYLTANVIAIALLFLAVRKPRAALWLSVAIFAWACVINTRTALGTPNVYLEYADLTLSEAYRTFILGWFSRHIQFMVISIAAGQASIALLLAAGDPWRRLGVAGAIVFLLAIAPLGVGSGFPFSLTFSAALLLTDRKLATPSPAVRRRTEARPIARVPRGPTSMHARPNETPPWSGELRAPLRRFPPRADPTREGDANHARGIFLAVSTDVR